MPSFIISPFLPIVNEDVNTPTSVAKRWATFTETNRHKHTHVRMYTRNYAPPHPKTSTYKCTRIQKYMTCLFWFSSIKSTHKALFGARYSSGQLPTAPRNETKPGSLRSENKFLPSQLHWNLINNSYACFCLMRECKCVYI